MFMGKLIQVPHFDEVVFDPLKWDIKVLKQITTFEATALPPAVFIIISYVI
jgi:hypothetical protein